MESGDDDVVSEDLSVETSSCIGKMSILNYMSTIGNYTGYPFSQEDIQTLLYGIASQRYGITSLYIRSKLKQLKMPFLVTTLW